MYLVCNSVCVCDRFLYVYIILFLSVYVYARVYVHALPCSGIYGPWCCLALLTAVGVGRVPLLPIQSLCFPPVFSRQLFHACGACIA